MSAHIDQTDSATDRSTRLSHVRANVQKSLKALEVAIDAADHTKDIRTVVEIMNLARDYCVDADDGLNDLAESLGVATEGEPA